MAAEQTSSFHTEGTTKVPVAAAIIVPLAGDFSVAVLASGIGHALCPVHDGSKAGATS